MSENEHITRVKFYHYKTFRNYSLTLNYFNVLVGPNNAGKSTILGAFRILSEAIRKARSRKPTFVPGPYGRTQGYTVQNSGSNLHNSIINMEKPNKSSGL